MYNIPVSETFETELTPRWTRNTTKQKKNHREFVVFDLQDIVQISQHKHRKQLSKHTQLFTIEETLRLVVSVHSDTF